ncbi:hypothetical protein MBLNU459_g8028t1 [Dothideomycetes sp. NU459]
MGVEPPYLYAAPTRESVADPYYNFDPKAVSRASYTASFTSHQSQRPKQQGPLINFNKHPDSYVVVPYGHRDLEPMPASTRKKVVVTRWIQFALRLMQLLGSLGLLVCVICFKGVDDTQSWVLRIPPAWDSLICCYAVYHLMRPAQGRTPASSASYHVFSVFMDIGLIPFMVFIAFFSEENWAEDPSSTGRWTSFFTSDGATDTLLFAAFILGVAVGALHLISIGFDIYLISMFRKIAQYPPDMNPLEESKTDKKASKHKYKNSEATSSISEKKFSSLSGSTLHLSSPSHVSLGQGQLIPEANVRPVSFYQSRTNLDNAYSGHTLQTARMSKLNPAANESLYQQPRSTRTSRMDVDRDSQFRSRSRSQSRPRSQGRPHSFATSHRGSFVGTHDPMPQRPLSIVSGQDGPSRYSTPQPGPQASIPSQVAQKQQKESLLGDNWYAIDIDDETADLSSPRRTPVPEPEDFADDEREPNSKQLRHARQESHDLLPQPLRMNPPSPTVPPKSLARDSGEFYFSDMGQDSSNDQLLSPRGAAATPGNDSNIGRALTVSSAVSAASSLYSEKTSDPSRSPSPKRKFYGDLAAATRGVLGGVAAEPKVHALPPPPTVNAKEQYEPKVETRQFEGGTAVGRFLPELPTHGGIGSERPGQGQGPRAKSVGREQWSAGPGKTRVVSRSGADIADATVMYFEEPADTKRGRGRQVSGKIAEEGRAGTGRTWGMRKREVSGVA